MHPIESFDHVLVLALGQVTGNSITPKLVKQCTLMHYHQHPGSFQKADLFLGNTVIGSLYTLITLAYIKYTFIFASKHYEPIIVQHDVEEIMPKFLHL